MNIKKIMSMRNSFLELGARVFIVTKNHSRYEVTYDTTYFNNKIWDKEWEIRAEDVERIELA